MVTEDEIEMIEAAAMYSALQSELMITYFLWWVIRVVIRHMFRPADSDKVSDGIGVDSAGYLGNEIARVFSEMFFKGIQHGN